MSVFHALHTVDLSSNRLTRLSRGLGALMLYHELRHTDLADNPWEMPHPSVCQQVHPSRPQPCLAMRLQVHCAVRASFWWAGAVQAPSAFLVVS
jgi:hypothetical protein